MGASGRDRRSAHRRGDLLCGGDDEAGCALPLGGEQTGNLNDREGGAGAFQCAGNTDHIRGSVVEIDGDRYCGGSEQVQDQRNICMEGRKPEAKCGNQ